MEKEKTKKYKHEGKYYSVQTLFKVFFVVVAVNK